MRKTGLLVILLAVLVSACGIFNSAASSNRKALRDKYSVSKNVIFYENKPFAELQAMTWSLDNGELVKEMNFKLIDKKDLTLIGGMIDFLSERHQGDEIEVEFVIDPDTQDFNL